MMGNSTTVKFIKGVLQMADEAKPRGKHGGKRVGAGRKPKPVDPTIIDRSDVDLLTADATPDTVETAAQRHARLAIAALIKQLLNGKSESSRVMEANRILDRGYGKPTVDIGGDAILPFAEKTQRPDTGIEIRQEAQKYSRLAIEVLARIAQFGQSETAKVAAASSLLDRGLGTVGAAKLPEEFLERPLGKRMAAAQAAAMAATGRFATPPPPKQRSEDEDGESGGTLQ